LNSSILNIKMEHLLSSKLIAYWGFATFAIIGIDEKVLDNIILKGLEISPIFTNLYMAMFTVYYVMKIYWYWQNQSLSKKERIKKLKNNL